MEVGFEVLFWSKNTLWVCVCVWVLGLGIFMYAKRRNSVYYGPAGKLYILSPLLAAFLPPPPPHVTGPPFSGVASAGRVRRGRVLPSHTVDAMEDERRADGESLF